MTTERQREARRRNMIRVNETRRSADFVAARFTSKILVTDGCWTWTAAKTRGGYGRFGHQGKTRAAHRVAYELLVGPIPDGLQLDHLCSNTSCVRPDHLEPVDGRTNIRRGRTGQAAGARNLAKTHCPQGHDYDDFRDQASGARRCRVCRAAQRRAYYLNRKARTA